MRGELHDIVEGLNKEHARWKVDEEARREKLRKNAERWKQEAERIHALGLLSDELAAKAMKLAEHATNEHESSEDAPLPSDFLEALENLRKSKAEALEMERKARLAEKEAEKAEAKKHKAEGQASHKPEGHGTEDLPTCKS